MVPTPKAIEAIPERRLRFDANANQFIEQKNRAPFLKGPIPLNWLSAAAALPGKTLNVALAVRWVADMSKAAEIHVTKAALQHFGLSEDAYRDGLKRLEQAGLVVVVRKAGQRARVRILPVPQCQ
jgi:hypothetical protein